MMEAAGQTAKASILIVEDETIVALDMRMRLERLGYRVTAVVSSGAAALESFQKEPAGLVLMDIKLKGDMDGIETASRLRQSHAAPVIFLTAFTDQATMSRVQAVSPYGYIVKPFHEREVSIAIELALSKFQYEASLREAVLRAEENNRAKTSFLSNISHELKTPLNSIIGFIDLALHTATDDQVQEYLLFAGRGARRLEASINALLDYTKLESNALVPVCAEYYLDDLLQRVWEPYAADAYIKGLSLILHIDPSLPASLVGDVNKTATMLKNLLENAVKFTTSGYVRLAATRKQRDGRDCLLFSVEDSGTGIPEEKMQQLFTPFSQVDASYTRLFDGLGLGLSLATRLAALLNLDLVVGPNQPAGTRVEVCQRLPDPCTAPVYPDLAGARVGGYGLYPVLERDLSSSLDSLGASYHGCSAGSDQACELDLLYVELSAWSKASAERRQELHAMVGCMPDNLIILGAPNDPFCYTRQADSFIRRPHPLSLPTLLEDLRACMRSRLVPQPGLVGTASERRNNCLDADPVDSGQPGPFSKGLAEGSPGQAAGRMVHWYHGLYTKAMTEASNLESKSCLVAFLADLRIAFDSQDFSIIERTVKKHHERFSDQAQVACTQFALSLLLDTRKGPGPWIHEMQKLFKTCL